MHLTCTNMPEAKLRDALDKLKGYGIQNVLALRGDPPKGQETFTVVEGGFACALDLVKYIRCALPPSRHCIVLRTVGAARVRLAPGSRMCVLTISDRCGVLKRVLARAVINECHSVHLQGSCLLETDTANL